MSLSKRNYINHQDQHYRINACKKVHQHSVSTPDLESYDLGTKFSGLENTSPVSKGLGFEAKILAQDQPDSWQSYGKNKHCCTVFICRLYPVPYYSVFGVQIIAISTSVRLSVHSHVLETACPNLTKFYIHFSCDHGSVVLWWQWNTYFGFVDDIMFSENGAYWKRQHLGFVQFARWRHRGRSLPSPTASCF